MSSPSFRTIQFYFIHSHYHGNDASQPRPRHPARTQTPYGIGVDTGEHAHGFKQLLQADAVDVVQIDSCRLAGVNEVLTMLNMTRLLYPCRQWCGTVRVRYSPEVGVNIVGRQRYEV